MELLRHWMAASCGAAATLCWPAHADHSRADVDLESRVCWTGAVDSRVQLRVEIKSKWIAPNGDRNKNRRELWSY